MRFAVVVSHPIQYQAPVFRALAEAVDLKVFFCWDFGVKKTFDRQFGREVRWDIPLVEGYAHEFVPNTAKDPGTHHFLGLQNPDLVNRVLAFDPDVAMFHGYNHWSTLIAIGGLWRRGVPLMMRGDSNLMRRRTAAVSAVKKILLPRLFKRLSAAVAAGSANRDYYLHFGVKAERVFVAPFTVDNDYFQRARAAARQNACEIRRGLGIADDQRVLLYAGKLIDKKGCDDLLHAFAIANRGRAALIIVGDGPLRAELEGIVRKNGSPVHFLGFFNQSDMPAAYALGDIFILPSHREHWGLAVNEAMNLGLPIIISDQVGAGPDLVGPDNGWVFPAGDVRALADVIDAAVRVPDLETMRRRSIERINAWGIPQTVDGMVAAAAYAARNDSIVRM